MQDYTKYKIKSATPLAFLVLLPLIFPSFVNFLLPNRHCFFQLVDSKVHSLKINLLGKWFKTNIFILPLMILFTL